MMGNAPERATLLIDAEWKDCAHGGGWWIAHDADGQKILMSGDLPRADLAPAPRVRPMEWNGFVSGNYRIEVEKGGIANLWYYSAAMVEDEEPTMMRGGYLTLVSVDDLKAAAQADYEARILAALAPPEAS